jgi:hypothetical protein
MHFMLILKLVEAAFKTHWIQSYFDSERYNSMLSTQPKHIRHYFRFRSSPAHQPPPSLQSRVFYADFEAGGGWYQNTLNSIGFRLESSTFKYGAMQEIKHQEIVYVIQLSKQSCSDKWSHTLATITRTRDWQLMSRNGESESEQGTNAPEIFRYDFHIAPDYNFGMQLSRDKSGPEDRQSSSLLAI